MSLRPLQPDADFEDSQERKAVLSLCSPGTVEAQGPKKGSQWRPGCYCTGGVDATSVEDCAVMVASAPQQQLRSLIEFAQVWGIKLVEELMEKFGTKGEVLGTRDQHGKQS